MAIIVKTGSCGSGKSLHTVKQIETYLTEGRLVYSNIRDLQIDGVIPIDLDFEWYTAPMGSVIIYDEAQRSQYFSTTSYKKLTEPQKAIKDQMVMRLNMHRHELKVSAGEDYDQEGAYDIIFITQHPSALQSNIIHIADQHLHFHRPKKLGYAYIYDWDSVQTYPESDAAKNRGVKSKFIFKMHKRLFQYYKSAGTINDKSRLPWQIVAVCLLPIVLFLYAFNGIFFADDAIASTTAADVQDKVLLTDALQTAAPATAQAATTPAQSLQFATVPQISMCVASYPPTPTGCRCKNAEGQTLLLDQDICYSYADQQAAWTPATKSPVPTRAGDNLQKPAELLPLPTAETVLHTVL